jgi:GNAT superfamily N-acetyltransferase
MRIKTCQTLADVMNIRQFLLDSNAKLPRLYNWEPRRWEGKIFHRNDSEMLQTRQAIAKEVAILFNEDSSIRAVVIPEYDGGAFLQALPDDPLAQETLIKWAIENLAQEKNGKKWLEVWCNENDLMRQQILSKLDFHPTSGRQNQRYQNLSSPKVLLPLPEGYVLRNVGETDDEFEKMANLLNSAFGRTFHSAQEYRNFATLAPSYKSELEIVVVAPNGEFAAHAGFTAHEQESFVVVEPVCTHPDHQNLGLARIAIAEGLNRCLKMGIQHAYIEAWYSNPVSNHVYEQMGFTNSISQYIWRKEF